MMNSAFSQISDLVIEEHVASTNDFFRLSRLTLDDLHCYANPLSGAARLVVRGAHAAVSDTEIIQVVRIAMVDYRGIDDSLFAVADSEEMAGTVIADC
jgi:hypothetical protein